MYMKVKDNLDFDEFLAEVGVAEMGIFSNQAEFDTIYQLCSTSSFFQQLFIWAPVLIRRFLHTDICLDIYPETLGVATIGCNLANSFC